MSTQGREGRAGRADSEGDDKEKKGSYCDTPRTSVIAARVPCHCHIREGFFCKGRTLLVLCTSFRATGRSAWLELFERRAVLPVAVGWKVNCTSGAIARDAVHLGFILERDMGGSRVRGLHVRGRGPTLHLSAVAAYFLAISNVDTSARIAHAPACACRCRSVCRWRRRHCASRLSLSLGRDPNVCVHCVRIPHDRVAIPVLRVHLPGIHPAACREKVGYSDIGRIA